LLHIPWRLLSYGHERFDPCGNKIKAFPELKYLPQRLKPISSAALPQAFMPAPPRFNRGNSGVDKT
jgi:hypothetical protein